MRTHLLAFLPFTALTFLCWGIYGPVLHHGKVGMGGNSFRQLICVGISYFVIAVIVPVFLLSTRGERGHWTLSGFFWSLAAGACGALGALGIINSLNTGGDPIYVMPLVFGGAPVVNTLVSMWMGRTFRLAGPVFYVGILLVAIGAAGVLMLKPGPRNENIWNLELWQAAAIAASIGLTVVCWGWYGSVLHKGQEYMRGSRLRPLLCVGLAYFGVAIMVPSLVLVTWPPAAAWQWSGAFWSLAGGACGVIGALGIILSLTAGGKPIYVMPLVFGGAPVVNTFVTIWEKGSFAQVTAPFFLALATVIAGAVVVLLFAPRHKPAAAVEKTSPPADGEPAAMEPSMVRAEEAT